MVEKQQLIFLLAKLQYRQTVKRVTRLKVCYHQRPNHISPSRLPCLSFATSNHLSLRRARLSNLSTSNNLSNTNLSTNTYLPPTSAR